MGPALLFEDVKGAAYGGRVVTNMLGNSKERSVCARFQYKIARWWRIDQ